MRFWSIKRQLIGALVIVLPIVLLGGYLFIRVYPTNSCVDSIKNGKETEVDCGGPDCKPCLGTTTPPREIWSRFFEVERGAYDVGAYLENPNFQAGSREFLYTFRLFDADNVLIAKRSGKTFFYPNERVFVYEPMLVTGNRVPIKVDFNIDSIGWERFKADEPLEVTVARKDFEQEPHPTVHVNLANKSLFEESLLEVSVILERKDGNAYAASRTIVENLRGGESRPLSFTWPTSSFETPTNITLLYRRGLLS